MPRGRWLPIIVTLACLSPPSAEAQLLSDPASLRHDLEVQTAWADSLVLSRRDAALRFLAVAEEIVAIPDGLGPEGTELLIEAQGLSHRMASLDQEVGEATAMVRGSRERLISVLESRVASLRRAAADADPSQRASVEAQARSLEAEADALRADEGDFEAEDPLAPAAPTLSALARVVAEEHERLEALQALQEELRLFLGDLRLFDETGMPPSARSGEGGEQDPGCEPSACAVGGASPADLPLMHSQPDDPGEGLAGTVTTPASLARLHEQIAAWVEDPELSATGLAQEDGVVARETRLGVGLLAFRGDGSASSTVGPRVGTSLVFSWLLGEDVGLTVEPSVGGRALRAGATTFTELAGEVRETLTGSFRDGRARWQVTSWQKGRYLSDPLSPPGYLEPGRAEGGLVGRVSLPLSSTWQLNAESGADAVRYEPQDWEGLDRHGLNAALGLAWRGASRAAGLALRGSYHGFPHSVADWEERRNDTRVGVEMSGSLEGKLLARLSAGGSWNESRIPAYDFWLARTALVVSAPWGKGSLQGYAALAHQDYLNPGPEDARIAPSDQDSGSVLSLQYGHPLDPTHTLMIRAGWSSSQTGFRNDFYERFGVSAHLTFRGE